MTREMEVGTEMEMEMEWRKGTMIMMKTRGVERSDDAIRNSMCRVSQRCELREGRNRVEVVGATVATPAAAVVMVQPVVRDSLPYVGGGAGGGARFGGVSQSWA